MQWSSWSKHVFERHDSYAITCAISRPRKRRVAQMHRAIYNILLPRTGWHLIPFPHPQRVYGRTLRHNQIFSDGWFTKFSYPWCSAGALRAPELRYNSTPPRYFVCCISHHVTLHFQFFWKWCNLHQFNSRTLYLLRLDNDNTSQIIAKYAHLMFKKRKQFLSQKSNWLGN